MKNKVLIAVLFFVFIVLTAAYCVFSLKDYFNKEISAINDRAEKEAKRLTDRTSSAVTVGEAVGYVIEFENGTKFYVAGDTGLSSDMKFIINDFYQPDVAILPIGGWMVMGPKEAAFATSLIQPKLAVIPEHYASYPMFEKTSDNFVNELKKYNLENKALTLKVGEEKEIGGVKVTWLGHATMVFTSPQGKRLIIDPSSKLGMWPDEYKDFKGFGKMDLVLVTHGHPDHAVISDLDKFVEMYNSIVMAPNDLGNWLVERVRVPQSVLYLINKGGSFTKNEFVKVGLPEEKIGDIKISVVGANHSSAVAPGE
jgi:L-ascorbate metabolism protein UlaG (beta-lactamase superfamily)